MGGWRRYLELQAQAKTGLSSGLVVWALLAVVFGVLTAGFVLLIAFIWPGRTVRCSDRGHSARGSFPFGDGCRGHFVSVVTPPNDRTGRAGIGGTQERDLARPQSVGRRNSNEPRRRLAQARSPAGRRHARCRCRDGMVRARETGDQERGAKRPPQACSRGVKLFPRAAKSKIVHCHFRNRAGNRRPPSSLNLRIAEGLRP